MALRGLATAAIDVSDGLLGDLGHLQQRSGVGASVQVADVPRSASLSAVELVLQRECLLAGGDDYELLFTAAPSDHDAILAAGRDCCIAITRIGTMTTELGTRLVGDPAFDAKLGGFDHFAGAPEA
jgi:thiamine-monophosphate kinase